MGDYSPTETIDIIIEYGRCNENARECARLYALRFPNRRHPSRQTISNLIARARDGHCQHDGAPAHSAGVVHDYLNERFPQHWVGRNGFIRWPPNSPDLTSCDYFRNRRIILHYDNVSCHTARQTVDFLSNKNVELMIHCPYSPDLSPNDFFLFPNIKKKMRGERFESPEAAVETFRTLISEVTASEWKKCFENWFERMQKCIDLKGEYFEKQ
ncbi:SETMR methyltransferase, partial [Acromyrmex heyeri]